MSQTIASNECYSEAHYSEVSLVAPRPDAPAAQRDRLSWVSLQYGRRRLARNVIWFGENLLATANALFSHVSKAIF